MTILLSGDRCPNALTLGVALVTIRLLKENSTQVQLLKEDTTPGEPKGDSRRTDESGTPANRTRLIDERLHFNCSCFIVLTLVSSGLEVFHNIKFINNVCGFVLINLVFGS